MPGGKTVSVSGELHLADIFTTVMTRIAISASPSSPAAEVAAAERYHGVFSGAMAADTSRRGCHAPNRRLVVR